MTFNDASAILQALANPKRLKIVDIISVNEVCACELLDYFQISQPTLSYDMKQLQNVGIVNGRKQGKWTYYSLNEPRLKAFHNYMGDVFFDTKNCLCHLRKPAAASCHCHLDRSRENKEA